MPQKLRLLFTVFCISLFSHSILSALQATDEMTAPNQPGKSREFCDLPKEFHYDNDEVLSVIHSSSATELIGAPFLFELDKDNRKSLLLGSCHWVKIEQLPNYARNILLSARSLVLETIESFKRLSKEEMIKYGMVCTSQPDCWINHLEPNLIDHLEKKLMPHIRRYHPDIALAELTPCLAWLKYSSPENNEGMDEQLQNLHEETHVFSLENVIGAFRMLEKEFDYLKFKEQLAFDYAKKQEGVEEETNYARKWLEYHYINGSLYALKDYILSAPDQTSTITRNHNWLPKIENYHMSNPSQNLTVVGLAHLFGEEGVLNLLYTQKSFSIRQITPNGSFSPIDINDFK